MSICVTHYSNWKCPNKLTASDETLVKSGETIELGDCNSGKKLHVCKLCLTKYPESIEELDKEYPNLNIKEFLKDRV